MILLFVLAANPFGSILMMGAILAVAYFFMIRPQTQREKEGQNYVSSITVGQQIVTAGGLYGKVTRIESDCFYVQIDKLVNVRLDKDSVAVEKTRKLSATKAVENA
jgi:preprotein translocase subunit YajC